MDAPTDVANRLSVAIANLGCPCTDDQACDAHQLLDQLAPDPADADAGSGSLAAPTPMDPRDMHGLAIGEGVDAGNWYTYCPACSWSAGEQVGKCLEPVIAARWPDVAVFVPKPEQR